MASTESRHPLSLEPTQTGFAAANRCEDVVEYFIDRLDDQTARAHVRALFGLFYALIFAAGLLGNGLVIASVWRYPALQTVRNFFIVSLSCSDMVVCLTSLPITPFTFIKKNWLFGSFLCYAFPLFQGMSILISTFTLMAVAIDRYILIIFPTRRPIQRAQAVPMIIGIWALAAGLCLPMVAHYQYYYGPDRAAEDVAAKWNSSRSMLVSFSEAGGEMTTAADEPAIVFCGYFCEEAWPSERVQKIYGTFVLVLQFLVPLTVIAFCYSHIWIRLARSAKMKKALTAGKKKQFESRSGAVSSNAESTYLRVPPGQQQGATRSASASPSTTAARQHAVLRRKRRTNRMLIAMVFIFACSWCPQVTMNLFRDLNWLPAFVYDQMYFYSLLCHAVAMSSTVWNPLLYSFMNGAFRSAFSELMPCFGRIKRTLSGRSSTRTRYGDHLRRPAAADGDSINLGAGNVSPNGDEQSRAQPILTTNADGAKIVSNRGKGNSTPASATETAALLPDAEESKSIPSIARNSE